MVYRIGKLSIFFQLLYQVFCIGQSNPDWIEAPVKIKITGIPVFIDMKFLGFQTCDPNDTIVFKGKFYHFTDYQAGNIKSCDALYETVQDTITSITLFLSDTKSREQARKQANKQFGNAQFSKNEMMSVYGWTHTTPQGNISISLAYSDSEPASEMYIKKDSSITK